MREAKQNQEKWIPEVKKSRFESILDATGEFNSIFITGNSSQFCYK